MRQQPAQTIAPPAPEIIVVDDHRVSCDGGGGALGHPRVYMEMGAAGFVECGYCDRRFVMSGHGHREDELTGPGA
jgi:uncharacterized Zn-finger protein